MKDMKKEIKKTANIDELSEFKQKLEKLLLKYPNLPEFTLKIQPRIDIKVHEKIHDEKSPNFYYPSYIPTTKPQINPIVTTESTPDTVTHISKNLEASITKGRIEELTKLAKNE